MLNFKQFFNENDFTNFPTEKIIIDFLFTHLERFGDKKSEISKAMDYALSKNGKPGGFILTAFYKEELVGVLVMNKTGMEGYIPENILVYVAIDSSYRNKGFGKSIIEKAISITDGSIKLHVEYDNPAKRLYERLGFTNKYAEMRLIKNG